MNVNALEAIDLHSLLYLQQRFFDTKRIVAGEAHAGDRHLLTDVDVPWVADPQRDMPHRREEIRERCLRELTSRGRPYVTVRGNWEERFAIAWRGYLAGLLEWGVIDPPAYTALTALVPAVDDDPAADILRGRD